MCYTGTCPYELNGDTCTRETCIEENNRKEDYKMNEQLQEMIDGLQFTNLGYEQEVEDYKARIKQLTEMIKNNDKKIKTLEGMKEA